MKRLALLLEQEWEKILSSNPTITKDIELIIDEVNTFVSDLLNKRIDIKELEENFLTPALVLIWKIDKLQKLLIENGIDKYVLKLDFSTISFNEFTDYYDFVNTDDWLDAICGNTTSLFNNLFKSKKVEWIYMLHQELYEHEDDTDDCNYFLIIKPR